MSEAAHTLISLMIVQLENEDYKNLETTANRMAEIAKKHQVTKC